MVEEFSMDGLIGKANSLYEYFLKTKIYVEDYTSKYDISDSYSLKVLNLERSASFESLLTSFISKNLVDGNNLITKLSNRLKIIHKFTLSEIAHRKSKEIEFLIDNPFFFRKLRKDYRMLNSELAKMDEEALTDVEDFDKFRLKFENIIERLRNLEYEIEDEKKSGMYNTTAKFAVWGIPILIGLYQLIAMQFVKINPYLPFVFYVISLFSLYILLKSVTDIKLLCISTKTNKMNILTLLTIVLVLLLIILTGSALVGISTGLATSSELQTSSIKNIIFVIMLLFLLFPTMYFYRSDIKETKEVLIQNEIVNLAEKYDIRK